MRILITAGPTREYLDDIRFISNESTGRMGFALAEKAVQLGHQTTVVYGPTHVTPPQNTKKIEVTSTQQMIEAVLEELLVGKYDLVISCAALSDYTPKRRQKGKIPSGKKLCVEFKKTKKLLKVVREKHPQIKLIGFKAEHNLTREKLIERAQDIKREYRLEFVVANDVSKKIFDSENTCATIVGDEVRELGRLSKKDASTKIFEVIGSW
ncbi:MAG: hypothetical protein GF334_12175 [Candidatus Altiarchaeales archaeon]|nr:hypothetical protein [Candidatus Altiarchaeales archaeon]